MIQSCDIFVAYRLMYESRDKATGSLMKQMDQLVNSQGKPIWSRADTCEEHSKHHGEDYEKSKRLGNTVVSLFNAGIK